MHINMDEKNIAIEAIRKKLIGKKLNYQEIYAVMDEISKERLGDVFIGDQIAPIVEAGAIAADRSGAFRIPGQRFMPHILHADRPLQMFGQNGCISGRVALRGCGDRCR